MILGFAPIDREHERIMQLAAELESLAAAGGPADEICNTLRQLAECAADHFVSEEGFMRRAGYPGLAWHEQDHAELRDYLARVASERLTASSMAEAIDFIGLWIPEHITQRDAPAVRFILAHQATAEESGAALC